MITAIDESIRSRSSICVSAVLPVYNEGAVLQELTDKLKAVLDVAAASF